MPFAPIDAAVADVEASPGALFRKSDEPGSTALALSACSKSHPFLPRGVRTLSHLSSVLSTCTCSPLSTVSTISWNDAFPARTSALVRSTHLEAVWPVATAAAMSVKPAAMTSRRLMASPASLRSQVVLPAPLRGWRIRDQLVTPFAHLE